jgi:branched-chain amino acid transport system substrate-binding protein
MALKKDFDEEKMPTIPASFHAGNLVDSNYIFLPIASYSAQAIGLAEYVANNHKGGTPKVAMFIHPSAFGSGPLEDVQKAVAAGLKMEIVEVVEHGKDLDNTAMLQRLKSKGVQYVISQTIQSPVATMLKDASRLGTCRQDPLVRRVRSPSSDATTPAATTWCPWPDRPRKISTGRHPTL